MLVVNPFFTYRYYLLQARISVGNKPGGFEVANGDRRFYFGNQALQAASQAMIDDLAAMSEPGDRLLVGPADLSRTIYSDAAFYYMFPELTPATFYIEMDPGLADQPGSRLADDVATADWLILTNFWTGWYEPNASSEFGSDEPNQVVADQFCLVGNYDNALVMLYQRCEEGDGISPAGHRHRRPTPRRLRSRTRRTSRPGLRGLGSDWPRVVVPPRTLDVDHQYSFREVTTFLHLLQRKLSLTKTERSAALHGPRVCRPAACR
jgi:hypothetical protein